MTTTETKGSGRHRKGGTFIDELKAYIGLTERDEELVRDCAEVVEPHFETIVASFYEALTANPRTQSVFDGPEQVARLRSTLKRWLQDVFRGDYDEEYVIRHARIGRVHVDVGLLPHFMFGAMNIIRRGIFEVLYDWEDLTFAHVAAIERALDMELTLMVESYWEHAMDQRLRMPQALASGIAHEIRNPLNSIGLNLTLLERRLNRLESNGDSVPILEALRSEVRRISNLTTEIIDFAKPVELQCTWYKAKDLLEEISTMHGPTLEASNIELSTLFEGEPPQLWCDVDRLRQALLNLLQNAVEAIEGPGAIELKIKNYSTGTSIYVRDSGEGMPAEVRHQVFQLFFTSKPGGTGLGLPIVRSIVEAHGGQIDVRSRVGEGTTFVIHIPRPRWVEEEGDYDG